MITQRKYASAMFLQVTLPLIFTFLAAMAVAIWTEHRTTERLFEHEERIIRLEEQYHPSAPDRH